jgi:glutathione synthase/RimK-type ligase-like ATP-grasp enzyme
MTTAPTPIAVATYRDLPDLEDDGHLLLDALRGAGLDPVVASWDATDVDWESFALVLVRSTWDYMERREDFLAWTRRCRRTANPAEVIAWNTDKHYLADLAEQGVPVVPTVFLEPGVDLGDGVDALLPEHLAGSDVVVKPAVGAGAGHTGRFRRGDEGALALVTRLHAEGSTAMVQPYLDTVEAVGETGLIHLGGGFSHAITKSALLTEHGERGAFDNHEYVEQISAAGAGTAQHEVAEQVLAAVGAVLPGHDLSYARVDLLPGADGPVLLEVELAEPSLFLQHAPESALRRWALHLARLAEDG